MGRYRESRDVSAPFKWVLRLLLKVMWSVGANSTRPRLFGPDAAAICDRLVAGDILLLGAGGNCSHVAVYVGDGRIVHSMATEKTGRGMWGSLNDMLARPWRWLLGKRDQTGVIGERVADFFDRFARDTWVGLRVTGVQPDGVVAGVAHVTGLIGKQYDYDFSAGDDEYYCTELVVEFVEAALPQPLRPTFQTRAVRIPGLLNTHVIEPASLLETEGFERIAGNELGADAE